MSEDAAEAAIHPAAQAYEGVAAAYERGRPHFPTEAVGRLATHLGLGHASTVLDLAAGTGRLTRHLVPRAGRVVAVEPVRGFREELLRHLPELDARFGTAEDIPVDDSSVDAVAVGQAFHWFDGPVALAEIDRVLRPGGRLGLIWNARPMHDPAHRAASRILADHRSSAPGYATMRWRDAFDRSEVFAPLASETMSWHQTVDEGTFCDRFMSVSVIAALPAADQRRIRRSLAVTFQRVASGPLYDLAYETHLYWTGRRS